MTPPLRIPFHRPSIGSAEIDEVADALRSGWLTTGPRVKQFEARFAEFVGARHAIAVNSCTAALHLALDAVGVQPGDRVITSPYTFTATAEVIRYLDAEPLFIDIEPDTLNLDINRVAQALKTHDNIRAIVPVHVAGRPCDMRRLMPLATHHNVAVIDDAAHALPTMVDGQFIGAVADITGFSFYVTKTLATGEGGMITTDNDQFAQRMRIMRLHGINRDTFARGDGKTPSWYYEVVAPGFKYNMTDIVAAIGIHQLNRQVEFRARRIHIAHQYSTAFADLPLQLPPPANDGDEHSWHLYIVQLNTNELSLSRDQFIDELSNQGIETSVHFIPLHRHPYWRERYNFKPSDFPVADAAYQRAVSLPIYPAMTDNDIGRVIDVISTLLRQAHVG